MSTIQKRIEKFNRIPIPNDITFDEFVSVAEYYGFKVFKGGGKHGVALCHPKTHVKIPVARHGNLVKEIYIRELKEAIRELNET